ncbi:MAG: hypothetical protein NZL96_03245 [Patescibacteria group bacterium]|nr:hypothetical protein [Patescibacteria group bacterium]
MARIKKIIAREIINSRGYPTIQGKIILDDDKTAETSFSSFERLYDYQNFELKDDEPERFSGQGVRTAVYYINHLIGPKLKGVDPSKQVEIDNWLIKADSTKNRSRLGVNTLMTISILVAKAAALNENLPLYAYLNQLYQKITKKKIEIEFFPSPIFSLLRGGRHGQVDLNFRKFQIIPSSSYSYSTAYELGVDLYHQIRHVYKFQFFHNTDVLRAFKNSIEKKHLILGRDVFLSIDFGANDFFKESRYQIKDKDSITPDDYYKFLKEEIIDRYSILVLIDSFANNDDKNWNKLYQVLNKETYLAVDDKIGSVKSILEKHINKNLFNSVIIRPNQIGTVTETMLMINFLRENNVTYIISSDLNETNESYLADLGVALNAELVSFGPPVHGENVAKYNRLLEIENEITG